MGASFRAPQGRLLNLGAKARHAREVESGMNLIWIIVVVLIVLFVLGYFGRGRFRS
jgi:flagellar basal body-associated protein FliL